MLSSTVSRLLPMGALALGLAGATASTAAPSRPAVKSLLRSAISVDAQAETITLPLFKGRTVAGKATWYIVTDSSSRADAAHRGVNFAPRLRNTLGTRAVQKARRIGSELRFAGTVDFSPERKVVPGNEGFPPATAEPGSIGDARYSPLVTTRGGVVLNAPQIKNATGQSDSVVSIDTKARRVTIRLLRGWFNGTSVLYLRTDASAGLVAALEGSTLAPNLDAARGLGSNAAGSARSAIIPVINGIRGKGKAGRQGLQSAVLGEGDPLNITQSFPGAKDYTPVWDLHPAVWTDEAIASGKRHLLRSAAEVAREVRAGRITSAGKERANTSLGGLRAIGFISNCSTVALG